MKYSSLLPFLDKEDLADVANRIISGELEGIKLSTLYPFLDSDSLNKIIDFLIKEKRYQDIYHAAPFLSSEKINELYEANGKGELEGFKTSYLVPFMSRKKIKQIFEDLVQNAENEPDDEDEDDDIDVDED